MQTSTVVQEAKTARGAASIARKLNALAFAGQRYTVEPGALTPSRFAVVLIDSDVADQPAPKLTADVRERRQADRVTDTAAMGGQRHYRRMHTASRTFG